MLPLDGDIADHTYAKHQSCQTSQTPRHATEL